MGLYSDHSVQTSCGDTGCWLCPVDGYVEVSPITETDGVVDLDDGSGTPPSNGARFLNTPLWYPASNPSYPAGEVLPEVTLFRLIAEETQRNRRTSGTGGLRIQACTELDLYGFDLEGILCPTDSIFCYLEPGKCMNFRFHLNGSGNLFWQMAARIGQFENVNFDVDEGTEVPWAVRVLAFDLSWVVEPDWDSVAGSTCPGLYTP